MSNLQNVNVFILKNTGGGKSLTFQLAAVMSDGVYLIISPLIALINDQCNSLSERNVSISLEYVGLRCNAYEMH